MKKKVHTFIALFVTMLSMLSCGGSSSSASNNDDESACSTTHLEQQMNTALTTASSLVDFSFAVVREDGRTFLFNRGASSLQTVYESASTSKIVAAVVIMRLVDQGYLSLNDSVQEHVPDWPIPSNDTLFNITLSDLLSFTSGLESDAFCQNFANADFEDCVITIGNNNLGNNNTPSESFYYGSSHLQVAGLMAVKATESNSWSDVFSNFKAETGLFLTSEFDLPSLSNPRLAGGMHWTGEEYLAFLDALVSGNLLSENSMNELLTDHTASASIEYSPAETALSEDWHYGFGLWHECQNTPFDCIAGTRISSPGAYGAYPFWDLNFNYYGIVARQGALGTYPEGVSIERSVRDQVEAWSDCP